jgi:hypothetical protein
MLILIWNVRDESFAWIREMTALMTPYEGTTPRYRSMKWRNAFDRSSLFTPLVSTNIKHVVMASLDVMIDRVASVSFVAARPENERVELLAKMRELYEREFRSAASTAVSPAALLPMPYEAQIFVCYRS